MSAERAARPDLDKVKARHVHQWDRCDTCALVAWVEHLEGIVRDVLRDTEYARLLPRPAPRSEGQ